MVFLGGINQDQLYEEMSECAVLCLPSLAESAPMVIAQAMAAGKPVIATRVGGVPEMVEEGVTGRLCEPDDPDQLALCLLDVLRDQSMRREMGKRARAVAVQRYRADSVAQSTLNAYCAVLGR
jgi:glycosyltransferase involved in cell wall biosynthesis